MKILALLIVLPLVNAFMPAPSATQEATHTIAVRAHRFAFEPAEITVKKGETVKLELTSSDVTHSLLVPGLGINQLIKKGHTVEVTFTPTTAGDFHGQCGNFCGSGHGSMLFTVHVTEE